jgi:cephalosporin hydroxylase
MSNTDPYEEFLRENVASIQQLGESQPLYTLTQTWINHVAKHRYTYLYSSLGRPIIQFPQDMVAMQELIWQVKPDLIIETGIAHGGSLIMSASVLALLDLCDAIESGQTIDPKVSNRKVLGIDIDIRAHNRAVIEAHPMSSRIQMIQGSSIAPDIIGEVKKIASGYQSILVCLDSNHTHKHVLAELEGYAPLTSVGSYCVVFDTIIEDMPEDFFPDRPWDKGNNPKTAVWEYLRRLDSNEKVAADSEHLRFEIDKVIENKLMITAAPDGFLKRTV